MTIGLLTIPAWMLISGFPISESAAVAAGIVYTLNVHPDLDLNRPIPGHPRTWLWWLYWWPYSKIAKHRGFISHGPIIGTLIRMVYCLWPLLFLLPDRGFIVFFIIGACISDMTHILTDHISTGIKRKLLPKKRKWAKIRA